MGRVIIKVMVRFIATLKVRVRVIVRVKVNVL